MHQNQGFSLLYIVRLSEPIRNVAFDCLTYILKSLFVFFSFPSKQSICIIRQMEESFSRKCLNFLERDIPMHTSIKIYALMYIVRLSERIKKVEID